MGPTAPLPEGPSGEAGLQDLGASAAALLASVEKLDSSLVGWHRLHRLVASELAAVQRRLEPSERQASHEQHGSNLPHLYSVVETAGSVGASGLLRQISAPASERIVVDVVAHVHGCPAWIKCVASPSCCAKTLEGAARAWLAMAQKLPENGWVPLVCFRFFAGVCPALAERLASLGVDVAEGLEPLRPSRQRPSDSINLDTTTLVGLVSNLTHGHVGWTFEDPNLENQAAQEASSPLLAQLQPVLSGKRLYAAHRATTAFRTIVGTVGGGQERARAERLLGAVSVVEGVAPLSLPSSRRLDTRMREVLGVGVMHRVPTTTANTKAVRTLTDQAAGIPMLEHMPRALTEQKQASHATECSRSHCLQSQELQQLFEDILRSSSSEASPPAEIADRPAQPPQDQHEAAGAGDAALPGSPARSERRAGGADAESVRGCTTLDAESGASVDGVAAGEGPHAQRPATSSFGAVAALNAMHDAHRPDATFAEACSACLGELRRTCLATFSAPEFRIAPFDWTPDVRLETFGSTVQDTAVASSDVDVRMSFEQFAVHGQDRQLRYLRAVQAALGGDFVVTHLAQSRLPVLRLRYQGRIDVDLTMGDGMEGGAEVDQVILALLSAGVDEGARRFVRLVKVFAKTHNLVDAYGGYLNSVSWVLLAISFLQQECCLPAHKDLLSSGPAPHLWPVRLTPSLFARFFGFVLHAGEEPHRVAIATGRHSRAHPFSWSGSPSHPLFVEHPKMSCKNLAQSLRHDKWLETLAFCSKAHSAFKSMAGLYGSGAVETVLGPHLAPAALAAGAEGALAAGAGGDGSEEHPDPAESGGAPPAAKRPRLDGGGVRERSEA